MTRMSRLQIGAPILAAGIALGSGVLAQSVSLTFATNTPPNNMRGEAEQIFLDELANASNGEITVIPYWGSSLMEGSEILGGVRDGVADMGFVNINYYPNQLLLNSAFNLFPKGPSEYEDIVWAFDEIYSQVPELNQEFEDRGQRVVYKYGVTPYAGTFRSPVTEISDMEGLRVRAASRWYLNLLQGIGATPVSMAWGDLYQGLQTGAIDGVFTNIDGIHRASLDEAAPNIFFLPDLWLAIPFIITINESKWQSLSDAQRNAFATAAEKAQERFSAVWDSTIEDILAAQKKAGITVTVSSDEAVEVFANLPEVKSNQEMWSKEARAAGIENPEAVLQQFEEVISEAANR